MEHASSNIETIYGKSSLHCFSFDIHEEDNILVVEAGEYRTSKLVRVQSACYTAEIFRSKDCDCHEQLDRSLTAIHAEGGLVVYMLCDGRGAGLLTKVRGLALSEKQGLDTYEAYRHLGARDDPRCYDRVGQVIQFLGLTTVRLMTNNPRKIAGLETTGIKVEHVPLEIPPTEHSIKYLKAKRDKGGHLLTNLSRSIK